MSMRITPTYGLIITEDGNGALLLKNTFRLLIILLTSGILLGACSGDSESAPNHLERVQERGTLVIATNLNHYPLSFLNETGMRLVNTKCQGDQYTAGELSGFDVEVGIEISKRLGIEPCFVTPNRAAVTSGDWENRWDISVGSITITPLYQESLVFTTPYYYTYAQFAARVGLGFYRLKDLDEQTICVNFGATYDAWLNETDLGLVDSLSFDFFPQNIQVVAPGENSDCITLVLDEDNAINITFTSGVIVEYYIAAGEPIMKLSAPIFDEPKAIALDMPHLNDTSLFEEIELIIRDMHSLGIMASLSLDWFGFDVTQNPGE